MDYKSYALIFVSRLRGLAEFRRDGLRAHRFALSGHRSAVYGCTYRAPNSAGDRLADLQNSSRRRRA